jgi:predicted phage terminase large subunit-like protein
VGVLIGILGTDIYIGDVVRRQDNPGAIEKLIVSTAALDGKTVPVGIPQDPGQAGKSQVAQYVKALTGYTVLAEVETGDKGTRFGPFSTQAEHRNVKIVRGPWNNEYISVLDSRVLASQFIEENELKYQFFADKWDAQKKQWTSKKIPTDDDAYRFFAEQVKGVDEDRRTGLVTVSMEWKDRHGAARWANLYVTRANDLLRARAMQEAKSSLEFLDRELANAGTIEIREAMYQLVEAQKKQQELMKACNEKAADKKGDERKKFMSTCLKGDESGPSAKQKAQQDRMAACNKQAGDKKLAGDERKKFMSACLKG